MLWRSWGNYIDHGGQLNVPVFVWPPFVLPKKPVGRDLGRQSPFSSRKSNSNGFVENQSSGLLTFLFLLQYPNMSLTRASVCIYTEQGSTRHLLRLVCNLYCGVSLSKPVSCLPAPSLHTC